MERRYAMQIELAGLRGKYKMLSDFAWKMVKYSPFMRAGDTVVYPVDTIERLAVMLDELAKI